jgi:hypothetical protein
MQRPVSLADLPPEARPRALALAVAELIREAGESAQAQPPPPPPPDVKREAAFGERVDASGNVGGELRHFFGHDTTLWGARLGLSLTSGRWQATIDAGAATSHTAVNVGSIDILLGSAALFVGPRFAAGPVVVSFGPTGMLGVARMKGQSTSTDFAGDEGSFLVATAGARAAVEVPAAHVVRAFAWAEAGLTLRHLDADVDGRPAAGISGPYIMVAAGLRFGPAI